jgi:hypothetical protein
MFINSAVKLLLIDEDLSILFDVIAIENKSQLIFGTMSQLDAAQIISGRRKNGFLLAHNGYVYQKNRTKSDGIKFIGAVKTSSCNVSSGL